MRHGDDMTQSNVRIISGVVSVPSDFVLFLYFSQCQNHQLWRASKESTTRMRRNNNENDMANDDTDGSLFDLLSPELLGIVFQWIGPDDMKSYIRLAVSGDPGLTHFIYTECTYLWKHLRLAKFPGIDDRQLQSLLDRINARSVTESIILDDETSSTITGAGLEPLRHSRVLESIDLRQSDIIEYSNTDLDDDLVSDILSTMIPHKLRIVKLFKQNRRSDVPFGCYESASWRTFFTNLRLKGIQACQSCSHCHKTLTPETRLLTQQAQRETPIQCNVCKKHSCHSWNPIILLVRSSKNVSIVWTGSALVETQCTFAIFATSLAVQNVKRFNDL